jgi:hypothetical protein
MLKELINQLSAPIFSFNAATLLFFWSLKNYRTVGSKKFAYWSMAIMTPVILFFVLDPNFFKIVITPDNVPISILLVLVTFFTWFTFHKAAENDIRIDAGLGPIEGTPENREKVWCWPNLVYTELFAIIACTVFLIVWAIIFKAPLEEPANPTWAPNPAKAPWYFLGLQEMLVYFDPWMAGVVLPGIIIVGLMAIPYIDTNPKGNGYYTFQERKMAITMFLYGWLVLWVYLIIIGVFLRGPNWTFYGPFEYWDFHKVVAGNNINLSEIVWIKALNMGLPKNMIIREIPGIVLTGLYFAVIPYAIRNHPKVKDLLANCGMIRYYVLVFLVLSMSSLPIKMILRWLFSLKYIVALPELEFNL